jgi:hypothetical protein
VEVSEMQRIESMNELIAVAKGGIKYIHDNLNEGKIICHPKMKAVIFPRGIGIEEQKEVEYFDFMIGFMFVYSNDKKIWTGDLQSTLKNSFDEDGSFYVADWKQNVFMQVEYYMMEEVIELLTTKYDDFILLDNCIWKKAEVGEITYLTIDEILHQN